MTFLDGEFRQRDTAFSCTLFFSGLIPKRKSFFVSLPRQGKITSIQRYIAHPAEHIGSRILVFNFPRNHFRLLVRCVGFVEFAILSPDVSQAVKIKDYAFLVIDSLILWNGLLQQFPRFHQIALRKTSCQRNC